VTPGNVVAGVGISGEVVVAPHMKRGSPNRACPAPARNAI